MNNRLKDEKGITLVVLTVTIIVLLIIINIVLYNVKDNLRVENLKNMQNDIEILNDKISDYYSEYGSIPVKIEYTNISNIEDAGLISSAVDTGKFYIIDLSAIENLTLTYGQDYKKITSEMSDTDIQKLKDLYIINEDSHNIFYVEGITIDNEKFYTNYTADDVDTEKINLRYVENIKIPDGYKYVEGTKSTGIIIKSDNENRQYEWVVVNEKIDAVPIAVETTNSEEFIESVNLYNGYYISTQENDNTAIYIPTVQRWSDYYDVSAKYTDRNGDTAIIPQGFRVSKTEGQDTIKQGLVIEDEQNNSYVWIRVPKSIYTSNENVVNSSTDYDWIYKSLESYVSNYRNEKFSDEWYEGCGLTSEQYTRLKNNMLKSIYENEGFWISQYEIGANSYVTSNDYGARTSLSKDGVYPYNFVTCPKAQELSTNMNSGDKTSSLLFGIQWDLVLKFIEENGDKTRLKINSNSTDWGNYYNSNFTINKGKFINYSSDIQSWAEVNGSYVKEENKRVLLTTGATKRNSALNIYDLAGNVWEWTLEKANSDTYPCTIRGGNLWDSGDTYGSASCRTNDSCNSTYALLSIGFRVAIY